MGSLSEFGCEVEPDEGPDAVGGLLPSFPDPGEDGGGGGGGCLVSVGDGFFGSPSCRGGGGFECCVECLSESEA